MFSGRVLPIACLACLGVAAICAQPSPDKSISEYERTGLDRSEVQAVIAQARSAPPEFGADAILTLVEAGLIPDRRLQHELLEEAFAMAGHAQETIAVKRGAGDSLITAALHGAFRNGIDQASLRARAVQSMLRLDNHAARELFERIELPVVASGACDQQTIPDFTQYYLTMLEVARVTPGREQMEAFFARHIQRFTSAAQITPLARVFMQIREIEHLPAVIDGFSARLTALTPDARVFSSTYDESIEAIGQLITSSPVASRARLIQQARAWVTTSVANGVCAETPKYLVGYDGSRRPAPVTDPVAQFNRQVARLDAAVVAKPAALSIPNSFQYFDFFRTHLLLAREDEGALDLAHWRSEAVDYIERLTAWSWPESQVVSSIVAFRDPSGEEGEVVGQAVPPAIVASSPPTDFFLEKSDLLTHVLFIERHAPTQVSGPVKITWSGAVKQDGPRVEIPSRERVLTALVAHLNSEAARKVFDARRALWFSPMRDLLAINGIADLYTASNHPVLNLYGRLAKLVSLK